MFLKIKAQLAYLFEFGKKAAAEFRASGLKTRDKTHKKTAHVQGVPYVTYLFDLAISFLWIYEICQFFY
jgi:hypothetical protein